MKTAIVLAALALAAPAQAQVDRNLDDHWALVVADHRLAGLVQEGPGVPGICTNTGLRIVSGPPAFPVYGPDRWCGTLAAFRQYATIACLRQQAAGGVNAPLQFGNECHGATMAARKVADYAKQQTEQNAAAAEARRKLRELGAE
jgi:hypothetical protein